MHSLLLPVLQLGSQMAPQSADPGQTRSQPSVRGSFLAGLAAATCLVLVASVGVTLFWYDGERAQATGDEPHYLLIAESLYRDFDFELANNYAEEAQRHLGGRPLTRHIGGPKTFSGHAPGLGLLFAIPYGVAGVLGAKLLLCVLASLIPVVIFQWMWPIVGTWRAALLTVTLGVGLPLSVAGNQIYPDSVSGILILGLVFQVARWSEAAPIRASRLVTFSLLSGVLPWLHVKYAAPALVLAAGAWLIAAMRQGTSERVKCAALVGAPMLLMLGGLAIYNFVGFGRLLGARMVAEVLPAAASHPGAPLLLAPISIGEFGVDPVRILQYLLGLHLDQAQGMFIQQPLLLIGLAGLVPMIRQSPRFALVWGLTYLSLIVPSAMSLSYGSFAPAGRFTWSVVWLWVFPLRYAMASAVPSARAYLPFACGLSLVYQWWLARLWLPTPLNLYPTVHPSLWVRNSLFAGSVRQALPSMYDVLTLFAYVPNWVFTILALLLVVSGAALAGLLSGRRMRTAWIAFGVVCAFIYPPGAPAWEVPENVQHHVSDMMDEVESLVVRRFEAEQLPSPLARDSRVADDGASGGHARRSVSVEPSDLMLFGPYLNLPAGRYRVEFMAKLEAPPPGDLVGGVDVVSDGSRNVLAQRWLTRAELGESGYSRVPVEFETAEPLKAVEFRVFTEKDAILRVDYIDLVPLRAALRRGWYENAE